MEGSESETDKQSETHSEMVRNEIYDQKWREEVERRGREQRAN